MEKMKRSRVVKGLHRFTFENYSMVKKLAAEKSGYSGSLYVGGHKWCVAVLINGRESGSSQGGERYVAGHVHVGIYAVLLGQSDGVNCLVKIKLLDQSGKGRHLTLSMFDGFPFTGSVKIRPGYPVGFPCFIDQNYLERSSYLKDDCLIIECKVGVVLPEIQAPSIAVPQRDDVGVHFLDMFKSGEASDVVFSIAGEKFRAHKLVLSARSSVFQDMFATQLAPDQHEMVFNGVGTRVGVKGSSQPLHDSINTPIPLAKMKKISLETGYAFGPSASTTFAAELLAAADEYDVRRLKNICESYIWMSISLGRFAETLHLSDRYTASALKHLCFKYAADNYYALVELGSFTYLKKKCPLLLKEVNDHIPKETTSMSTTAH